MVEELWNVLRSKPPPSQTGKLESGDETAVTQMATYLTTHFSTRGRITKFASPFRLGKRTNPDSGYHVLSMVIGLEW